MTVPKKRAVPVKMIWMFIVLGVTLSWMLTVLMVRGRMNNVMNAFYTVSPNLLLIAGTAVCLARGTLNLALPGTACLCAALFALISRDGSPVAGIIVALVAGTALGALNGVFAIQSGKKVLLVTGIASLAMGFIFQSFVGILTGNQPFTVKMDRYAYIVFCWIGIFIAAAVCILGGLGRLSSPETGEEGDHPSGASRFLWTMASGALAGLSGVVYVARLQAVMPSAFSGCIETYILPALLLGGILIPNFRRSTAESVLGMVAVVLAGLCVGFIYMYLMIIGADPTFLRMVMGIISALLLIPNILIRRGNKKAEIPEQ